MKKYLFTSALFSLNCYWRVLMYALCLPSPISKIFLSTEVMHRIYVGIKFCKTNQKIGCQKNSKSHITSPKINFRSKVRVDLNSTDRDDSFWLT